MTKVTRMLLEALVFTGVYLLLSIIIDLLSGVKLHLGMYVASAAVGFKFTSG